MEEKFDKSRLDRDFRRRMKRLIDAAEKEILVITGEAGAFEYFQDLRWAIQRAISRGVSVKVFATSPKKSTVNKMIYTGCKIYLGKADLEDHYTIIDGKWVVESREHKARELGVRYGKEYKNVEKAKKLKKLFGSYIIKGKKAKVEKGEDPMLKIMEKPLDLGFETDSSEGYMI